jgi:hypothetical protein
MFSIPRKVAISLRDQLYSKHLRDGGIPSSISVALTNSIRSNSDPSVIVNHDLVREIGSHEPDAFKHFTSIA